VSLQIHEFVDEGLGHSSSVIDLDDGSVAIIDPPGSRSRTNDSPTNSA
jgi:hypothetical protein